MEGVKGTWINGICCGVFDSVEIASGLVDHTSVYVFLEKERSMLEFIYVSLLFTECSVARMECSVRRSVSYST